MKKLLFVAFMGALVACGETATETTTTDSAAAPVADTTAPVAADTTAPADSTVAAPAADSAAPAK
ncbi:MAG: entericidin [Bacteroidetes bacterium]|uniref:hypothetical protein n=1 Tax=Phnomibacter sp. TaxID=2836217 RepID=UPI002FDCCC15|nr:entericidin [Bacteroidota bacterium]